MRFWTVIVVTVATLLIAGISCKKRKGQSDLESKAMGEFAPAIRIYRKVIGRDPKREELAAMRGKNADAMIDAVLSSPAYFDEGFLNVQRDRLLLNREQSKNGYQNSHLDYCSLRMEMRDAAVADATGATGFWQSLRYRERWVSTKGMAGADCLTNVTLKALKEAKDPYAAQCIQRITSQNFAVQIKPDSLLQVIASANAANESLPLASTPEGKEILINTINRFTFPTLSSKDGILGLGGKMKIEPPPGNLELRYFAPNQSFFDCSYTTTLDPSSTKLSQTSFVKLIFPEAFEGLHANPYWLSRHPTKPSNQHLHRARRIYFSYLCTDINPDAANSSGDKVPEVPQKFKPYFADTDMHALAAQNCFSCHARIQPLANYFGLLSMGRLYESTSPPGPEFSFESRDPHNRPGGFVENSAFFPAGNGMQGMNGLATMLSANEKVAECIVDSTWATLVGRENPLTDLERAVALAKFKGTNEGNVPRLTKLISHLLKENTRGKNYLNNEVAAAATEKAPPPEVKQCSDLLAGSGTTEAIKFLQSDNAQCAMCHSGLFFSDDGAFDFDLPFKSKQKVDSPEGRGTFAHDLYCNVATESMPPGGGLKDKDLHLAKCFLKKLVDDKVAKGEIPATFKDKLCEAVPDSKSEASPMHTIK